MGEIMTPKQIAKRIKARGYGKQHLYCQMCKKQCRDENSFKQHRTTAKHIARMAEFSANEEMYVDKFSSEFENGMLNIIKTVLKNQLVPITTVHHHYIRARSHTRLNGTRWETLDEFAQYLGKTGKAEVEQTAHGFSVIYRDKDPDLVAKQEKKLREKQIDQEDQLIQSWIDNHKSDGNTKEAPAPTEIDLNEAKNIKFEFKQPLKKSAATPLVTPLASPTSTTTTTINTTTTTANSDKPVLEASNSKEEEMVFISNFSSGSNNKFSNNSLQATKPVGVNNKIRENEEGNKKRKAGEETEPSKYAFDENEMKKKRLYRKANWLCKGIVVKVINKQLGNGKYYKQKGVVEEVLNGGAIALIKMIDMSDKLKMDQSQLETVIPNIGGKIMIVNGMYQGSIGTLTAINESKYSVQIKITSGDNEGKITWEEYEDVSKIN